VSASGYDDPRLADLYDALNPWGPSDDHYLGLIREAASVLDLGCGTGQLLKRAVAEGHGGPPSASTSRPRCSRWQGAAATASTGARATRGRSTSAVASG